MNWIVLKAGITLTADAPIPTSPTDGEALPAGLYSSSPLSKLSVGTLRIASTAGSGTMTISGRLWGYYPAVPIPAGGTVPARWCPLGTSDDGTDALRGAVNGGFPIGETSTDQVDFVEQVAGFDMATRLAFQCTAVTGTFAVVFGSPDLTKD
jgi:hypothetical protein